MQDFRDAQAVALELDGRSSAELAELKAAAVERITDAALELAATSDRGELAAVVREYIQGLGPSSLAQLLGVVLSEAPRYDLRPLAGVVVALHEARHHARPDSRAR